MNELIEAIRVAVTDGATAEQKATGAQACRTIIAALGAETGKPIVLPGAPKPHPLAALSFDQALDLVIARLRTMADARELAEKQPSAQAVAREHPEKPPARAVLRGPQIPLVPRPAPMPSSKKR